MREVFRQFRLPKASIFKTFIYIRKLPILIDKVIFAITIGLN